MFNIPVKNIPCISCEDVDKLLVNFRWSDCEFAQLAADGSYVPLCLDDSSMEDLHEAIGYEMDNPRRRHRLENQLCLANLLRRQGYRDMVLIHIFW